MTQSKRAKRKTKASRLREQAKELREDRKLKQVVNTKSFWQRQTFGPASEVRHVDPKDCDGTLP